MPSLHEPDLGLSHVDLLMRSPVYFRQGLLIDVKHRGREMLGDVVEPWQLKDFEAIDPCLMWLAGKTSEMPRYQRFYFQRARGHSKTSDIACNLTWLLFAAENAIRGIAGAEDRDQAKLIRDAMMHIASDNAWLKEVLEYKTYEIVNKDTGASMQIVSSDVASSWGATPDFVVCDEFTHWTKADFWNSLFSSFAKRDGMLIVACNAGMGRDWKWSTRETARLSGNWYYSAPTGCLASWFTPENLEEQRSILPPAQ